MSMNFAREQSLLRQKLQAKASAERAAARSAPFAGAVTFLGADDGDVASAAEAVAAAWPQMGRAQMTAFVRTLWSSKVHELRDVGSRLLAMRAALLEPADLPLLETFLAGGAEPAVLDRLARDVLGAMAIRAKKVWKDLRKLAAADDAARRRLAVVATERPLAADAEAFPRFAELAEPLLAHADAALLAAIDGALTAAAAMHRDAVHAFAARHGRAIAAPAAAPAPTAAAAKPTPIPRKAAPAARPPRKAAPAAPKTKAGKPEAKSAPKPRTGKARATKAGTKPR
jgi:hypothetical protein